VRRVHEAQGRAAVAQLEQLGVTWLAVSVPCESRAEYCEKVAAFGRDYLRS